MAANLTLLSLFEQVACPSYWAELAEQYGLPGNRRIYSLPVVVWLMLNQRLKGAAGTQRAAVAEVVNGRPESLLQPCKRVREGKISVSTAAYSRARSELPPALLQQAAGDIISQLRQCVAEPVEFDRPVYVFDGSTVTAEHEPELLQAFPPGANQHGPGHWAVIQVVVLHDLFTGIALPPVWGPMYGDHAVSEQALCEKSMDRLAAGSVVMGDSNFGVFSVAYGARRRQLDSLLRLTADRAQALGGKQLRAGLDLPVTWKPSAWDRKKHPELPNDAEVQGRLLVVQRPGFRDCLFLFTTLPHPAEQIINLYLRRWNIETDLRSLKRTVSLFHLTAQSPDMIEKELLAAVIAYGLVRVFMTLAARQQGSSPRELSFSAALVILNASIDRLCSGSAEVRQQAYLRIVAQIRTCKLPKRPKRRSYPREVWGHRQNFPRRRPKK